MRVLVFHSAGLDRFPSGEESVARSETSTLVNLDVDVRLHLASAHCGQPGIGRLGLLMTVGNCLWSSNAYRAVKAEIADFRPDVVHFHGLMPFLSSSALAAAHDSGVAVVQTLHNGRWLCVEGGFYRRGRYCDDCVTRGGSLGVLRGCNRGMLASAFLRAAALSGLAGGRLFRWVDRFIAVSDFIKDVHVRAGFPADRITVKNNGIDLSQRDALRSGKRSGIAYVSRISISKGVNVLKEIIASVPLVIHVVGDGPDLSELHSYCRERGFAHVTFWGQQSRERCLEIMASAQCTVVPSQCGESFSLVAAESMSVGTPVVASDVGGLGSLIRSAGGGLTTAANDAQGFVDAIRLLDRDRKLAERLGRCGRQYVEERLEARSNGRALLQIYEEVLASK